MFFENARHCFRGRVFLLLILLLCHPWRVSPFAAKKRNPRRGTAKTTKGFGKAPPTLEEVLEGFQTREPEGASSKPCPCGVSGKTYSECCKPFHLKAAQPLTPTQVLQSRYSAVCYRNIGYIIQTTHPTCRDYLDDKVKWAKDLDKKGMFDSYEFAGLNILGAEELPNENEGYLEFQVQLRERVGGQVTTIQERSKFLRDPETGVWKYSSGDVRSTNEGLDDIKLNP